MINKEKNCEVEVELYHEWMRGIIKGFLIGGDGKFASTEAAVLSAQLKKVPLNLSALHMAVNSEKPHFQLG